MCRTEPGRTWSRAVENRGSEGYNGFDSVITRDEHDEAEAGLGHVLLILQIAVHGDQCPKAGCSGSAQQLAILKAGPARLDDSLDVVARQRAATGRGTDSSRRTRTRQQGFASPIESGNRLRAGNRGKGVEKLVETVPSGQIVDETLGWNPGANEHRRPAQDIGIAVNHVSKSGHPSSLSASPKLTPELGCRAPNGTAFCCSVVGSATATIGSSDERSTRHDATIRTTTPAVAALVHDCVRA